jgi:hypothetical protein
MGFSASKNKTFTTQIEDMVDMKILNVTNAVANKKAFEKHKMDLKYKLA